MPIRKALGGLLSDASALLIETALRDLVEEILDDRGLVRRSELAQVAERVEQFRRELTERRTELAALRQSVEVLHLDFADPDDDLLGDEPATPCSNDDVSARLDHATGALDAVHGQIDALTARLDALTAGPSADEDT